jgi:hypothetical protein
MNIDIQDEEKNYFTSQVDVYNQYFDYEEQKK